MNENDLRKQLADEEQKAKIIRLRISKLKMKLMHIRRKRVKELPAVDHHKTWWG